MIKTLAKLYSPRRMAYVVSGALALAAPLYVPSDYWQHVLIMWCIYGIGSVSLNLIMGYTGQFSLAHGAFFGIGAYSTGLLMVKVGLNFWPALLLSCIITACIAFLIGLPTFRTRMIYFAIATICFNVIVTLVIERWTSLTGGPIGLSGIPEPSPIPLPFRAQISFESLTAKYYLVLLFLVLTIIITYRLVKSLTGRTFISIRDDEAGARDEELAPAIGINTLNSKLLSFAISGFFAGLSGCLYAVYFGHLTPHISNYLVTFDFLTYCVIGGIGTMLGPLVGVITLVTASELMYTLSSYRLVIFGVLLIVFMVFIPRGIVGEIEARWSRIIKRVKGG